jgi:FtsZ-binding cell division protein ZapB
MIDDKLGQQLHDRATRGLPLSEAERAQLDAWYREWDEKEAAMLAKNAIPLLPLIEEVRESVDKTWSEIAVMARSITKLRRENAKLRRENAALEEQLQNLAA